MDEIANKATWKNEPIDNAKRIVVGLQFTEEQFSKLSKGIIPRQMEDKWFVYYEDEWLYFHRSWTGFGIYKAKLNKDADRYSITEFWAERNHEKYSNESDEADIENFRFLIGRGLLGIDVTENYSNRNINTEADVISGWSTFGNMLFTNRGVDFSDKIKSVLFGVSVGDALGVPVEFMQRQDLKKRPVTDMIGNGTHQQPAGTWSDDSSLTFCLAEALTADFNLETIAQNFVEWYYFDYWTAHGAVFDVGNATREAIVKIRSGVKPELAGGESSSSNGNGSLMRILPLLFYLQDKPIDERFEITRLVSSITHRHIRSIIACFYYLEYARLLMEGQDKFEAYKTLQNWFADYLQSRAITQHEIAYFDRLLKGDISQLPESEIKSSGYVIHTLEASVWCFLTTANYAEAVLKAVNLGDDSDTTGAVTGGLAGLYYGWESIPNHWIEQLARKEDIVDLARRLGG